MSCFDKLMRAAVLDAFGAPCVLVTRELRVPKPEAQGVLIAVERAGVTFLDTLVRAGRTPRPEMLPALPVILGNGVGGVVSAVGPGVDADLVGRRVISSLAGTGGYAEAAVAAASDLVSVPSDVRMADAVAVLADGRTANLVLDAVALRAGETVLVAPAGGGFGTLFVQLARAAGARVIAAAGSAPKLELALELGADRVLDYRDPAWAQDLDGAADVLVDGVGGDVGDRAARGLRKGGRRVLLGMSGGRFAAPRPGVKDVALPALDRSARVALVRRALDAVANGSLRPVIAAEYPLDRAADAHAAIEQRTAVGKTLLALG